MRVTVFDLVVQFVLVLIVVLLFSVATAHCPGAS